MIYRSKRRWARGLARCAPVLVSLVSLVSLAGLALLGCGAILGLPDVTTIPLDGGFDTLPSSSDGGIDASNGRCDPTKPFGAFEELTEIEMASGDASAFTPIYRARLVPNEQTLYFSWPGSSGVTLFRAKRSSNTGPFGDINALTELGSYGEPAFSPSPTFDDLNLYFTHSPTIDGAVSDETDLLRASRPNTDTSFAAFSTINFAGDASLDTYLQPFVLPDSSALYAVKSSGSGANTVNEIVRAPLSSGEIGTPVTFSELSQEAQAPTPLSNELTIYFAFGSPLRIWIATRQNVNDPFSDMAMVPELAPPTASDPRQVFPSWASDDGCVIYLDVFLGAAGSVGTPYRATKPL